MNKNIYSNNDNKEVEENIKNICFFIAYAKK